MTPRHSINEGNVELYECPAEDFLPWLSEQGREPAVIFMDPPYNIGVDYGGASNDLLDEDQYVALLTKWIGGSAHLLPDDGSFWINIPDRWAANCVTIARDCFDLVLENWCIWHYRFGPVTRKRFITSKVHALWFSKGRPIVCPDAALVPSDRAMIYGDERAVTAERMDFDVWGFDPYWGRVQGNNRERVALHPNQLPEAYLRRIIEVCSEEGHLVVDLFNGSGTGMCIANSLGRRGMACDVNPEFLDSSANRILRGPVCR